MSSTTTKTKIDLKPKIFFNNRPVGYVHVEYVFWHPGCEHDICEECVEEYGCGKCHRDWNSISTNTFAEFIAKPKQYKQWTGTTQIRFTTDSSFLTYDMLDDNNNILWTNMIPINMISSISVHQTEPEIKEYNDGIEEIDKLNPDLKKSMK
jgi:hypothetical protein